jgi:outer membrane protein
MSSNSMRAVIGALMLLGVSHARAEKDAVMEPAPWQSATTRSSEAEATPEGITQPSRRIYWSITAGLATTEELVRILRGRLGLDFHNPGLAGFGVGTPIAEDAWGLPLDFIVKANLLRHFEKGIQANSNEYTVDIKLYFKGFPWRHKIRTRFGLAEGLSYATKIPSLEEQELIKGGSDTSHLLNHLEVGIDVNLGDIFTSKSLDECYFGFGVQHRSGIFGAVGLYNNVDGGLNYNTLYLECIR